MQYVEVAAVVAMQVVAVWWSGMASWSPEQLYVGMYASYLYG